MPKTSRVSGFYQLSVDERVAAIAEFAELSALDRETLASRMALPMERASHMIENATGLFSLPLGFAANFRIDGQDRFIPMVIEEPSVVAAASHAAKLLRSGEGIVTKASRPVMIGQIQLCDISDPESATVALIAAKTFLLDLANATQPRLVERGGGAIDLHVRSLSDARVGNMLVVHLHVDVCDAMGANMVNTMVEALAPECERMTGGNAQLRILSNLADQRMVHAEGRVSIASLRKGSELSGEEVANRLVRASVFAEVDPYRAATHNKGFMNGLDAYLIAMGQDWRAVEAGAHAYAARNGNYTALATWTVDGDFLVGRCSLPMQVGTVGGIVQVHPLVRVNHRILRISGASELARIGVAVGLAQNLAAILALSTDGIQKGHMALHARNIASAAGASTEEVEAVANEMVRRKSIHAEAAQEILAERRR